MKKEIIDAEKEIMLAFYKILLDSNKTPLYFIAEYITEKEQHKFLSKCEKCENKYYCKLVDRKFNSLIKEAIKKEFDK